MVLLPSSYHDAGIVANFICLNICRMLLNILDGIVLIGFSLTFIWTVSSSSSFLKFILLCYSVDVPQLDEWKLLGADYLQLFVCQVCLF